MLEFFYNYSQLVNNIVPPTLSFDGSLYTTAIAPIRTNIIDYEKSVFYTIFITTFSWNQNLYETYSISCTESKTNQTVGSIEWISSYKQSTTGITPFQTTTEKLVSVISSTSGIFFSLSPGDVTVFYDNYTGERRILIQI